MCSLPDQPRDASLARGLIAAALARADEALLPLRALLATTTRDDALAEYFMRLHHQQSLQALRAYAYKTNDIIEVGDDLLTLLQQPGLSINGARLELDARELLLVFVLARHARTQAGPRDLFRAADAGFASVATLLEEIDRAKAEAKLDGLWQHAIDTDVHKAVSSLRAKLASAGLNRNLIEGKRGSGYRLSTPYWNLISFGGERGV